MRRALLSGVVICAVVSAGCGSNHHAPTATSGATATTRTTAAPTAADPVTAYRRGLLTAMTTFEHAMKPLRDPASDLSDGTALAENLSARQDVYVDTLARMKNLDPPARYRRLHRAAEAAFNRQYTALGACQQPLYDVMSSRHHSARTVLAVEKRCLRPLATHAEKDKAAIQALMVAARVPFSVT
jgi:hypothetical protein